MTRAFTASPLFGFGFQAESCDDPGRHSDKSAIAAVSRGSVTRIAFFILLNQGEGSRFFIQLRKDRKAALCPCALHCSIASVNASLVRNGKARLVGDSTYPS